MNFARFWIISVLEGRFQQKADSSVSGVTHKLLSKPGLSNSVKENKTKCSYVAFNQYFNAKHFL